MDFFSIFWKGENDAVGTFYFFIMKCYFFLLFFRQEKKSVEEILSELAS